jgi:hypothetical protein
MKQMSESGAGESMGTLSDARSGSPGPGFLKVDRYGPIAAEMAAVVLSFRASRRVILSFMRYLFVE